MQNSTAAERYLVIRFYRTVNKKKVYADYTFDYSTWQLLVKKEGQCATWAFTTYYVLKYAGFDVRVVRGVRENRDGGGQHFWCQLTLQGNVYTIDTQFDETPCSEPIESEVFCWYIPQEYYG